MSDYEDDMDVDGAPPANDIVFSTESNKGKRSTANLPVEAEDSLPWCVFFLQLISSIEAATPI